MLDLSAVETLLVGLFNDLTGLLFIVADQDAPRPSGTYGTIKISGIDRTGWDSVTFENEQAPALDLVESIKGLRSLAISTNIFRDGAMQSMLELNSLIHGSAAQQTMRVSGLGLGERSTTRNLAELLDNQTEQRSQMDINFYVVNEAKLITAAVASVEITGEYQVGSKTTQITVEVP